MLRPGDILEDKYKILHEIGRGGMSVVYLALNEKANKSWAVKEIHKEGVDNLETIKQSLVTEVDILKKLSHKSLPSIVDVVEYEDSFVMVMDYIEGVTLEDYISQKNEYSEEDVVNWALQLCDVLEYLHSQTPPIIYRDMKPGNIMLKPDGTIVLIDFGASREFKEKNLKDTICFGTRGYAAPEQFTGNKYGQTDARTDVFGLGTTMYQLLTGHNPSLPPYEIRPIREWDASLSGGLEVIVSRCTKNNPEERYQNCRELKYALQNYSEQDLEYQRSAKKKLTVFFMFIALFVFSGLFSIWGKIMETKIKGQNYDTYVSDAVLETTLDGQLQLYEKAIALDPKKADAYNAIFDTFMDDGVLEESEDQYLRTLMAKEYSNSESYETCFSENVEEYSHFAYNMAMAYWYSYGTIDGSNISYIREYNVALRWFAAIPKPSVDDEVLMKEYNNATTYSKIGTYYSDLGKINRAGDTEVNYSTYLNDLIALFQSDDSNAVTRLYLNKEIVYQVVEHANDYKSEGMERETLEQLVNDVSLDTASIQIDTLNESLYNELISDIESYIETATKSISSAYQERGDS